MEHLRAKVDAGAEFIVTQLFYDVDHFLVWLKKVRAKGTTIVHRGMNPLELYTGITVPIVPGIMPLQSYASFLRLTKLCGTKVPPKLHLDLDPLRVSRLHQN